MTTKKEKKSLREEEEKKRRRKKACCCEDIQNPKRRQSFTSVSKSKPPERFVQTGPTERNVRLPSLSRINRLDQESEAETKSFSQSTSSIFATEITTVVLLIRVSSDKQAVRKFIYSLMMTFIEMSTSLLAPRRSSLIRPAQNKRGGVGEGVRRKEVTSCTEFSLETTLRVFDQGEETSPPSVSINPVFTVISRKTSATTVHQRHQRFQSGQEN